ncbi:leucine Rich repeat-containing domain [Schistosoma japonicum]|uniref:Leucine Rich repeat-containing domain n=1 Tax=Schistosoma japonicum TaxID=6182 RepID=A0A4Z2DF65_SCHJA|nr:leucine Rich repeat-containing domain [Schistosoma japonicum]
MHSCLTLVDYTWKDSEESGTSTPKYSNFDHIYRLRRTARSLDGETMNSSLNQTNTIQLTETNRRYHRHFNDMLNHSLTQITNQHTTYSSNQSHQRHHHQQQQQQSHRHSSMLLLNSRRLPIYAASKQLRKGPDHIWVPVGHCRYLLERDLCTGEIQWNPEGNEIICTPRSLAEICMARLIRDWPCMLPTRRSSLRNIVNFLFNSCDIQSNSTQNMPTSSPTSSSSTTSSSLSGPRRSASLSSHESRCKTDHYESQNSQLIQNNSLNDEKSLNNDRNTLPPLTCHDLPITVLINLISEAILQRDCSAITGLIANWPCEQLIIKQLIPNEEYPLIVNYMTKPTFVLVSPENESGNRNTLVKGPSLLDAFILGFLTRQPGCKLKSVDFTGFEEDCRVSIELSRLPILWMKPESRNSESVRRHLMASLHIGIPRKRLEAYISRISTIYAFHEADIGHGEPFDTVTIHLDCNMTVDEVALGLSLQTLTPFRFSCNRLLLQRLPEINFPPYSLIRLFDPLSITQFELEDPTIGSSIAVVLPSAVGWLISLRNLRACSLPSCIPPPPDVVSTTPTSSVMQSNIIVSNMSSSLQSTSSSQHQSNMASLSSSNSSSASSSSVSATNTYHPNGINNSISTGGSSPSVSSATSHTSQNFSTPSFTSTVAACRLLNRALVSLRYLQRLGLARCHLTGQLKTLLGGLSQPLEYLNLQDCCLSSEDIHYLVHQWRPLHGLYELNLSRNNLSVVPEETLYEFVQNVCLKPRGRLVCLSIAYTCLSTERLIDLLSLMAGMDPSHSLNENDEQEDTTVNYTDKWIDKACTLRVLCIQSFIPPAQSQIHRILYRITRLSKLHKLHLFPAFYAFPGDTEIEQRELRINQLIHSRNYLRQRSRSDIEIL